MPIGPTLSCASRILKNSRGGNLHYVVKALFVSAAQCHVRRCSGATNHVYIHFRNIDLGPYRFSCEGNFEVAQVLWR